MLLLRRVRFLSLHPAQRFDFSESVVVSFEDQVVVHVVSYVFVGYYEDLRERLFHGVQDFEYSLLSDLAAAGGALVH